MCRCLVKYILFFFNLLFTLIGLALVGVGIAVIVQLSELLKQLPIDLNFVAYIIIALGVIVFVIAFSGCCGAVTESKCLLITYAVFMAVLALIKIVVTILLYINLPDLTTKVESYIDKAFEEPASNITFHALETALKCCGTKGPSSYVNEYNLVPATCCENFTETSTTCSKDVAFETGCTAMVGDYFTSLGESVGTALIIFIVWELVAMVFSIYIIRTIIPKDAIDY